MDLYLSKDIIQNKKLSNQGIFTYIAMRSLININRTTEYFSINQLAFAFYGVIKNKYKNKITSIFSDGLENLSDNGLITTISKLNNNDYIIDVSKLILKQGEYYVVVRSDEIQTIVNGIDRKDNMLQLVRYFVCIVASFNLSKNLEERFRGKICGLTIDTLADYANISEISAKRYNDTLSTTLKLIWVSKSNDYALSDGNIKRLNNTYARYEDKDLCDVKSHETDESIGYKSTIIKAKNNAVIGNHRRRLSQLYREICKGKTYSDAEMREVYDYMVEKNKITQEKIDFHMKHDTQYDKDCVVKYQAEIKDLSMFDFDDKDDDKEDNDITDLVEELHWDEPLTPEVKEDKDVKAMYGKPNLTKAEKKSKVSKEYTTPNEAMIELAESAERKGLKYEDDWDKDDLIDINTFE